MPACNLSTVTFCGFALGLGLGAAVAIGLGGSDRIAATPGDGVVPEIGAASTGAGDGQPATASEAQRPVPVSARGPVRLPALR